MPIVPYIPKSKRVTLYRIIDEKYVEKVRLEGIVSTKGLCIEEPEPRRETAVFAYTKRTLERIIEYGEPSDYVVIFLSSYEGWMVGDLHYECTSQYPATVTTLKEILDDPWKEDAYREMECWLPNGYIPREQILEIKKRRDF